MKIISFSLWGSNPKYTIGAVKNAKLAKDIYPGWQCVFYVSDDVPPDIIKSLKEEGSSIIEMGAGNWFGLAWRFLAADIPDATVIVRDTDSRLNLREKAAVDAWITSGKKFHIMRDHPFHVSRVMGGMWGVKPNVLRGITQWIKDYPLKACYDSDQQFLRDIVYPKINDSLVIHDEFMDRIPFPVNSPKRTNTFFVGQVYDPEDNPLFS